MDPDLTEDGLEMAQAFAEAYRATPWAAIYSSPLKRTVATAQALCDLLGREMELRDGLKEIGYGAWEGQTKDAMSQRYPEDYTRWVSDPAWNAPTQGETAVNIALRGMEVIEEMQDRFGGGAEEANVLVVSHKATIRILLCSLMGMEIGRYRFRLACPVGSVSVVKLTPLGPFLQSFADRSYLSERLINLPGT
jgi:probable phosphoglycerate mutase